LSQLSVLSLSSSSPLWWPFVGWVVLDSLLGLGQKLGRARGRALRRAQLILQAQGLVQEQQQQQQAQVLHQASSPPSLPILVR